MTAMSGYHHYGSSGRIVVLLGPRGAGKARILSGIVARDSAVLGSLPLTLPDHARIAICSSQHLLHSHLTAWENLQLAASLSGAVGWEDLLRPLWDGIGWRHTRGVYAESLSRTDLRMLALSAALLHDPDLLLIDDLGLGLSQPAQRYLWQVIARPQRKRPNLIIYATRDLQAACRLGDEVWVVVDDILQARWMAGDMPQSLATLQAFALTLKTRMGARQLLDELRTLNVYHRALRQDGLTVDIMAQRSGPTILDLALAAGSQLHAFAKLTLDVDLLPGDWYHGVAGIGRPPSPALTVEAALREPDAERQSPSRIVALIALAEWKRFFRPPVKVIWPLSFQAVLLSPLLAFVERLQSGDSRFLAIYDPILQAVAAAPAFLLGVTAISRWLWTADMKTLFSPARSGSRRPASTRPLTLLSLYDLAAPRRHLLIVGVCAGVLLLLMAHTTLFFILWFFLLVQSGLPASSAMIGLALWFVLALDNVALSILLAVLAMGARWLTPLSLFILALVLGSAALGVATPPTVVALWPFTGLALIANRLLSGEPLGLAVPAAILGSIALWLLALRAFWLTRASGRAVREEN